MNKKRKALLNKAVKKIVEQYKDVLIKLGK
jgi:hypothetical protein